MRARPQIVLRFQVAPGLYQVQAGAEGGGRAGGGRPDEVLELHGDFHTRVPGRLRRFRGFFVVFFVGVGVFKRPCRVGTMTVLQWIVLRLRLRPLCVLRLRLRPLRSKMLLLL